MATIASLLVNLGMNTAAFEAGTNRARRSMNAMTRDIQASAGRLKTLATAAAGVFVGVRMVGFAKTQMESIDKTAKLSDALGVGTEQLVGFQRAAELGGASSETFNRSLQYLAKNLGTAVTTGGSAASVIQRLGLNAEQLAAAPLGESFLQITQAISDLSTPAERAAAAMEIFGRSGMDLLPMLSAGRSAIERITAAAIASGGAFSKWDAKKVEQAMDAITKMSRALRDLMTEALIDVAPMIVNLAEGVVIAARAFKHFANAVFGGIGEMVKTLITWWAVVKVAGVLTRAISWTIKVYRALATAQAITNAMFTAAATGAFAFITAIALVAIAEDQVASRFDKLDREARKAVSGVTALDTATEHLGDTLRETRFELGLNIDEWRKSFASGARIVQDLTQRRLALEQLAAGWSAVRVEIYAAGGAVAAAQWGFQAENLADDIRVLERDALRLETITNLFADLNEQMALYGKGPGAAGAYRLAAVEAGEDLINQYQRQSAFLDEMKRSTDELAESQRRLASIGQKWFDTTRTPAEKFAAAIREINESFLAGAMSFDTWLRAADQISRQHAGDSRSRGEFRQIESARIDVRGLAGGDSRRQELNAALSLLEIQRKMLDSINAIKQDGGGLAS